MSAFRRLVIGALLGAGAMIPLVYIHDGSSTAKIHQLERTIDSAKHVRAAAVESIAVYVPVVEKAVSESDRLATLVMVAGDSALAIRTTPSAEPTIVAVPPEVVSLINAQAQTISELQAQLARYEALAAADSAVIAPQDSVIVELKKGRRCGAKCGAAIALGAVAVVKLAIAVLF